MHDASPQHAGALPENGNGPRWKRRLALAMLALCLAVGIGLRAYGLDMESVWGDDYCCIGYMNAPTLGDFLEQVRVTSPDMPPLYFVLAYGWAQVFGDSPMGLRWLSILAWAAGAVCLFALGATLFDTWAATLATLCFAMSPIQIFHSQGMRGYALVTAFAALSSLALWRATHQKAAAGEGRFLQGGRGEAVWWAVNLAANTLLCWTHLLGAALLAAQGGYLVLAHPRRWGRTALWIVANGASLSLLALYFSADRQGLLARDSIAGFPGLFYCLFHREIGYLNWNLGLSASDAPAAFHKLEADLLRLREAFAWLLVRAMVLYAALTPARLLWDKCAHRAPGPEVRHRVRALLFLLLWAVVPALVVYGLAYGFSLNRFAPRYSLFCSLALYLMAGGAVACIPWRLLRVPPTLLVLVLFGIGAYAESTVPTRGGYLGAAAHVRENPGEARTLIMHRLSASRIGYNIFEMNMRPMPLDMEEAEDEAQLGQRLREELARHGAVWVALLDVNEPGEDERRAAFETMLAEWGTPYDKSLFYGMQRLRTYYVRSAAPDGGDQEE